MAENRFRRVLRHHPNDAGLHNDFGSVLKHARRLKEAEREYEIAISLKADYTVAMGNLGVIRHEMHDWKGAADMYKKVLVLKPQDSSALYNLGNVFRDVGNVAGGAAYYRGALGLKYLGGDLVMLLSLISKEDLTKHENALTQFERLLKRKNLLEQDVVLREELDRLDGFTDATNNLSKLALEAGTLGASYDTNGIPWIYNQWMSMLMIEGSQSVKSDGTKAGIHLLVQYYQPTDAEHQEELQKVLTSHMQNHNINGLHVFVEENYDLKSTCSIFVECLWTCLELQK